MGQQSDSLSDFRPAFPLFEPPRLHPSSTKGDDHISEGAAWLTVISPCQGTTVLQRQVPRHVACGRSFLIIVDYIGVGACLKLGQSDSLPVWADSHLVPMSVQTVKLCLSVNSCCSEPTELLHHCPSPTHRTVHPGMAEQGSFRTLPRHHRWCLS